MPLALSYLGDIISNSFTECLQLRIMSQIIELRRMVHELLITKYIGERDLANTHTYI